MYSLIVQQVEGLSGGEESGTYFVDQSDQYYYQANNDETPVMTQVQIQEVEEADVNNDGEAPQKEQYHEIEELENVDGDEDGQVTNNGNNKVVINSGDAYQTEGTEGEEGEGEGEQDLTVYDFEDNEDNEVPVESEVEDDKTKIVKILPKKSQAHMCNYCNCISPKSRRVSLKR